MNYIYISPTAEIATSPRHVGAPRNDGVGALVEGKPKAHG